MSTIPRSASSRLSVRHIGYDESKDEVTFECRQWFIDIEVIVHISCSQEFLKEHSFLTVYNYLGDELRRYYNQNLKRG